MQTKTRANWVYKKPVFLSLRRTFFFLYIYITWHRLNVRLICLPVGRKEYGFSMASKQEKKKDCGFACAENIDCNVCFHDRCYSQKMFLFVTFSNPMLCFGLWYFSNTDERGRNVKYSLKVSSSSRSPWLVIFICFCFGPKNQVHLHHEVRWLRGGHPLPPLLIGQGL